MTWRLRDFATPPGGEVQVTVSSFDDRGTTRVQCFAPAEAGSLEIPPEALGSVRASHSTDSAAIHRKDVTVDGVELTLMSVMAGGRGSWF